MALPSRALCAFLLVGGAGCLHDDRAWRDRGGSNLFDRAPEVKAPPQDRCAPHGQSAVRQPCEEARYLAQRYARKLSVGDPVCLEGGVGDDPSGACLARAAVADVAPGRVLLEIRDARPDSRWHERAQHQVWFAEGALVDLYLAERGY